MMAWRGEQGGFAPAAWAAAVLANIAQAIIDINTRLGLSSSIRELGYPDRNLDDLADAAMKVHFNATAPRKPTRDDYKIIITDALGQAFST